MRACRDRLVAMLDLFQTEFLDRIAQRFFFLAHLFETVYLRFIMRVDYLLDSGGAGMRRLFAEQRGCRTEREAGHMPDGRQRRRPYMAFVYDFVEACEMHLLIFRHAGERIDDFAFVRQIAKDGALAFIDADRAIFTGMVDADHFFDSAFARAAGLRGNAMLFLWLFRRPGHSSSPRLS